MHWVTRRLADTWVQFAVPCRPQHRTGGGDTPLPVHQETEVSCEKIQHHVIATPLTAKLPTDPLGPAWWPKYLSLALGVFSVLLILQSILTPKEKDRPAPFDLKSEGFHRVLKLCGILIIFAILTFFLGIYIGLLLMVPTVMYLLGERKK